jgi:hypothetical protein
MLEDGDGMSSAPVLIDVTVTPEADAFGQVGGSRVVNGSIAGTQSDPAAVSLHDGATDQGYVIVWTDSAGADGSGAGVFAQLYAPDGTRLGGEFQINEGAFSTQDSPEVAALTGGGFAVTWYSVYAPDGAPTYDVLTRVFAANGAPVTGEINLTRADFANNQETEPQIAATADGGFAVTWRSTLSADEVYAQFFNADGTSKAALFQVNPTTTGNHTHPAIAGLADGNAVVAYAMNANVANGGDGYGYAAFIRIVEADGAPVTPEIRVNDYIDSEQYTPSVAALTGGGFAVIYRSQQQDGSNAGVYGQLYDDAGDRVGGNFRVTEYTTQNQYQPEVTATADGGFAVVWYDDYASTPGASRYDVYGQRYAADGSRVDGQFLVTPENNAAQYDPAIAARPDGGFVVAWRSDAGEDGDGASILHAVYGDPASYGFQNVSDAGHRQRDYDSRIGV